MEADPNDALAAFTEYAADRWWIASHLTQLAGVVLIIAALLLFAGRIEARLGRAWLRVTAAGAVASLATAAALQAVDGIALKAAIDAWQAAPAGGADAAFRVADSVRSLEKGLSAVFNLANGCTVLLLSAAVVLGRAVPRWIGLPGAIAGGAFLVLGFVTAATGFSAQASTVALLPTVAAPVFLVALAVALSRGPRIRRA
jgi:hypothetical protein